MTDIRNRRGPLPAAPAVTGAPARRCRLPRHPHARPRPVAGATPRRRCGRGGRPPQEAGAPRRHRRLGVHAAELARGPALLPGLAGADPFDTYVFGFRDVTGMSATQVAAQRGKAQISAPMLSFDEEDDITITLTNLGLLQRPDLFDGHTLHWHGFVNAIPLFDGVPELSLAVPVGRDLVLLLPSPRRGHVHVPLPLRGRRARADGHDRHGLRPAEAEQGAGHGDPVGTKYAYNDGDGSHPLRPRVRLHDHRAVVGRPLPRRPHPGQRLDRLRPQLLAAQRPRLPRHDRAQRRPDVDRPRAGCSTSRSRRWSAATPATGCCCGCRTSATRTTP